jgi:hypothetical protein
MCSIGRSNFPLNFHVVDDNIFPSDYDLVLGLDVLKFSKIDFLNKKIFFAPTLCNDNLKSSFIELKPNSVNFVRLNLNLKDKNYILRKYTFNNLVIIPNSLINVSNKKAYIKIINLDNKEINIPSDIGKKLKFETFEENRHKFLTINENLVKNRNCLLKEKLKLDHLESNTKKRVENLCLKFNDIFFIEGDSLKKNNIIKHNIDLDTNLPIFTKQYPIPQAYKSEINKLTNEMLEQDIIENSLSPYNSPIILVKKKTGDPKNPKFRFVIDLRNINKHIKPIFFSLPTLNEMFDQIGDAQIFSKLDMQSGYFQIGVNQKDSHKLAFTTPLGRFQFKRVPFGLSSASFIFQKMMSMILNNIETESVLSYIDDLMICSKTINEHIFKLEKIFSLFKKFNLTLNPSKCEFMKDEVEFLGHNISGKGIKPKVDLDVVKNYKRPTSLKEVRGFLGFIGFFRNHLENYSTLIEPLVSILRKNKVTKKILFSWNMDSENAFITLKKKILSFPILRSPDYSKRFLVFVDASNIAVGCSLCQEFDGEICAIQHASKTLSECQRRYSTFDREFFAVIFALTKAFKNYLLGQQEFVVYSDHKALINAINQNMEFNNDKINRYKLKLSPFNFKIIYLPGKKNPCADFLSRIKENEKLLVATRNQTKISNDVIEKEFETFKSSNSVNIRNNFVKVSNSFSSNFKGKIVKFVLKDLSNLDDFLKPKQKNNLNSEQIKMIDNFILIFFKENYLSNYSFKNFFSDIFLLKKFLDEKEINSVMVENINEIPSDIFTLIFKYIFLDSHIQISIIKSTAKEIFDSNLKKDILNKFHNNIYSGHNGIKKTIEQIKQNFKWKNLAKDVIEYIKNCVDCQIYKNRKLTKIPLKLTSTSSYCFEKIYIDFVGPLEESYEGFQYILTVKDDLSKFLVAIPLKDQTSESVAQALVEKVFLIFSCPKIIVSDNAHNLNSDLIKKIYKLFNIKKINCSIHHPQSNQVERAHPDLKKFLRICVKDDHKNWVKFLPHAIFNYNSSVNTDLGYSPFNILFGRVPSFPHVFNDKCYTYDDYVSELKFTMKNITENVKFMDEKAKLINKKYYDKKSKKLNLKIGDKVLMKNQEIKGKTFNKRFLGPFEVTEIVNNENVKILVKNKEKVVHKNLLKEYHEFSDESISDSDE